MSVGFKLNEGDLVMENGEIAQIEGDDLTVQTIQQVLSTNKGEWLFNTDEGIEFDNIFGKKRTKTRTAADEAYQREIADIRKNESRLAEALAKRLDGVL